MQLYPISHYATELRRRLPAECFRPVPHRLLWIIPHLALTAAAMAAVATGRLPLWGNLLAALAIGHSFACLGFLGHEILHGSVVRSRRLASLFGTLCFWPLQVGVHLWRRWHNTEHHGHTQDADQDPDAMGTLEHFRERPLLQAIYRLAPWLRSVITFAGFGVWFTVHAHLMVARLWGEFRPRERLLVLAQLLAPVAFWAALGVWLGPTWFTWSYVVPLVFANFLVMSYIATNHMLSPLTPVNDPLANSLTVRVPRLLDILHFHFSHHTEHHLFPTMNPRYAPRVKALIQELWPDRYQELPHWQALWLLWKTPRLYASHTHLADPVQGVAYPTLGHGLDPHQVEPQPLDAAVPGQPAQAPIRHRTALRPGARRPTPRPAAGR